MAAGGGIDPIHQFQIHPIVELKLFGLNLSFTNTSLWMVIVLAVVSAIMIYGSSQRSVVPGRLQSLAEMIYEFVAQTLTGVMGREGMKFFPFVFSLFMFVLASNMLGMLPGSFTVTSQIIVTAAFAVLVMAVVLVYGIVKHGTHFFGLFVPSGVPGWLLPFMVLIEAVSFMSRPVSLSLRLFGNMLAGHIALKVFGGFVVVLLGSGAALNYAIAPLPLLLAVALTALEFLVAFLQAYVFAILTCVYLNDALHPGH
ncbi:MULTISPECIES: F0F1 ATP synthase subunit A [unclassified Bosea (in: a-proteobacteria)]|uniref:F0F1 ATP synthase subunit A n=1 Tax=unclassified Bosea (in: a-proteobacteria) TaxID=2653178 RepID=UPI0009549CF1|nr:MULTISPECIES: F0F1 ATP synthase subunit A [unclassified Bosea (in: a-proteobacteria)]TAJ29869.1 MAG: F0F1 ATP synthase subunit A [Bosea sp. (in: a-proteobacteria)]SIQ07030.1 ATP synthase F0 subcomplex A subunit [Bosea sp. TND4EK4]